MKFGNAVVGELSKALTLPGVWAGLAVGTGASAVLSVINATTVHSAIEAGDLSRVADTSAFETAFAMMPLGTVGAVIIGVMLMGSEYTMDTAESGGGRQIATTLRAIPNLRTLIAAKSVVTVILTVAMALISLPVSILLVRLIMGESGVETVTLGEAVARCLGGTLYWVLMGLIALAIAALTRTVMIPLTLLIINGSMVSFSFLLTKVTSLADYLPDMAGRNLFVGPELGMPGGLDPLPGAIVMAIWTIGLLMAAVVLRVRTDG